MFDVLVGPAVAVFLALAALDHLLTATVLRRRYEAALVGAGLADLRRVAGRLTGRPTGVPLGERAAGTVGDR